MVLKQQYFSIYAGIFYGCGHPGDGLEIGSINLAPDITNFVHVDELRRYGGSKYDDMGLLVYRTFNLHTNSYLAPKFVDLEDILSSFLFSLIIDLHIFLQTE